MKSIYFKMNIHDLPPGWKWGVPQAQPLSVVLQSWGLHSVVFLYQSQMAFCMPVSAMCSVTLHSNFWFPIYWVSGAPAQAKSCALGSLQHTIRMSC